MNAPDFEKNCEDEHFAMPVVCMIVERRVDDSSEQRILLQRRIKCDESFWGTWELPQGRIRSGESIIAAARRELKEETNLDLVELNSIQLRETLAFSQSSIETLFPGLCAVDMEHGYVGIAVIVRASGTPWPTAEACNHKWVSVKDVRRLMKNNRIFPLNAAMLKMYLEL